MILEIIATFCAGIFAGAALYINAVEHPARIECGTDIALREFAASYGRATIMQSTLAAIGLLTGLIAWWIRGDLWVLTGAILLGTVIPFTLLIVFPTNRRLHDPKLKASSGEAATLLKRWGWLHGVRTILSGIAFLILLSRLPVNGSGL